MIPGASLVVLLLSGLALPPSPPPIQGPAGCFEAPETEGITVFGPMREKALGWDRLLLGTLVRGSAGEQLEQYRKEEGIPLEFMLGQEGSVALQSNGWQRLKQVETAGSLQPHPCGMSVQAFVKDLGSHDLSEWLQPDWVLEYNRKGKVIARWDVPLNAPVRAVQGDSVWVSWDPQPLCSDQSLDLKILSGDRDRRKSQGRFPPRAHLGGTQDRMPQEPRYPAFGVPDLRVHARPQNPQNPQVGLPVALRLKRASVEDSSPAILRTAPQRR